VSVFNVPTFADPFYSFGIALEGVPYVFDFRYNQREDSWYLGVALPDGTELITGVKVVCNRDLLRRAADVRLPPGRLMALANAEDDDPPGLGELGEDKRVTLVYFTSDETYE
jgi:hypothetical protein